MTWRFIIHTWWNTNSKRKRKRKSAYLFLVTHEHEKYATLARNEQITFIPCPLALNPLYSYSKNEKSYSDHFPLSISILSFLISLLDLHWRFVFLCLLLAAYHKHSLRPTEIAQTKYTQMQTAIPFLSSFREKHYSIWIAHSPSFLHTPLATDHFSGRQWLFVLSHFNRLEYIALGWSNLLNIL